MNLVHVRDIMKGPSSFTDEVARLLFKQLELSVKNEEPIRFDLYGVTLCSGSFLNKWIGEAIIQFGYQPVERVISFSDVPPDFHRVCRGIQRLAIERRVAPLRFRIKARKTVPAIEDLVVCYSYKDFDLTDFWITGVLEENAINGFRVKDTERFFLFAKKISKEEEQDLQSLLLLKGYKQGVVS